MVMPNHMHGILEIVQPGLAQPATPLERKDATGASQAHSLSVIVRTLKANVTRRARIELRWSAEIWQKNYYDRVIRDDREFVNAMRYIAENPSRWQGQTRSWEETEQIKGARRAQRAAPLQRGPVG